MSGSSPLIKLTHMGEAAGRDSEGQILVSTTLSALSSFFLGNTNEIFLQFGVGNHIWLNYAHATTGPFFAVMEEVFGGFA